MIALKTVALLLLSNIFMTFAWYGHLRFKSKALLLVILASWGIAFFEYCLQVPANRIGHGFFSAPQLKVLQEAITFGVFIVFSWIYLKERPTFYDHLSFLLIIIAVAISLFQPRAS
ncbi:MAG: DMT family protein [Bdellovibrionota bacterium]